MFVAWWVVVLLVAALVITSWARRMLGKPPLFQTMFRMRAGMPPGHPGMGGVGSHPGAGGVEPPPEGAVVIEGEYVVEGEGSARTITEKPDGTV